MSDIAESEAVDLRVLFDSGAVVGAPKRGAKRFWTTREVAIIRAEFPTRGVRACMALLPGRTAAAIYQKAASLGFPRHNARGPRPRNRRYTPSREIDAAIERAYGRGRGRQEALRRLSAATGWPRDRLNRRAQLLGYAVPRLRQAEWSEAELEILRAAGPVHPDTVRKHLAAAGHRRTRVAILVKRHELDIRLNLDENGRYTATALAEAFGVNRQVIVRWTEKGWLKGRRLRSHSASSARPVSDGASWQFLPREVREFVIDNVAAVDFHKVNKEWLVDLLTSPCNGDGAE